MSDSNKSFRQDVERIIRYRPLRLLLATGLMAVGTLSFMPYITYKVAPVGFVNSELIRISAPISGQLTKDLPRKGDFLASPVRTTLIESNTVDRSELSGIEQQ